jgi:putative transposase
VRVVLHRDLEGEPKTVTVRRSPTGKWYVTIACKWEPTALTPATEPVGIDVGLAQFATFSTGERIENPRFFRTEAKALAQAQRRLAKDAKGTPERRKCRKAVARVHERVRGKRQNFAHQESRKIVDRFQVMAVEDLSVKQMVRNHCLAKSISDAAWSEFLAMVRVKAGWAERVFVAVNPAYTSQQCSRCGHRQTMPLSERVYRCPDCSLELDRDVNAARRILSLGLQALGLLPESLPLERRGAVTDAEAGMMDAAHLLTVGSLSINIPIDWGYTQLMGQSGFAL